MRALYAPLLHSFETSQRPRLGVFAKAKHSFALMKPFQVHCVVTTRYGV
jgi:hypothetical protein